MRLTLKLPTPFEGSIPSTPHSESPMGGARRTNAKRQRGSNPRLATHGIDTGFRRLRIGVCISIDVPSTLYRGLMATSVRDVVVRFHPLLLTQNSNTWTKQLLTASNTSRRPMQVKSKRGVTPLPTPTTMYLW